MPTSRLAKTIESQIAARVNYTLQNSIRTANDAHFHDLLLHESAALVNALADAGAVPLDRIDVIRAQLLECKRLIDSAPRYTSY
jgi:hypothetical protein